MLGKQFLEYILRKRPEYSIQNKELIDILANQGQQTGFYTSFGPIYQIYMYGFFLGYHLDEKIPLPISKSERKEFYELDKWSPKEMVNYILMLVVNDYSKLEFGLLADWDDLDESQVKKMGDKIVSTIEEYSNAGLKYLSDYYQRNKQEFEDPFVFIKILKNICDNKRGTTN